MKVKSFIQLSAALLLGAIFLISCESDEALAQYVNPNQTDTTGNNIKVDLFVSIEIDNIPFSYINGVNDYSNWTLSE